MVIHALFRGPAAAVLSMVFALAAAPAVLAAEDATAGQPAAEEAAATVPEPRDIERVIETLEDPESRAELVRELKVLLEAERAGQEDAAPARGDVLEIVRNLALDAWHAIVAIDPRQLLVSIAISIGIILVALLVRWLIGRLLKRMYVKLTSTDESMGDEDVVEVAQHDTAEPELQPGETPQLPGSVTRLLNLIIGVLAVALIAEAWGAGLGALLQTDLGARIAEAALSIGLILIITLVAWHVAGLVVARLLTLASSSRDEERRARRLDTLVPLLRSVLQGIIGVLAALLILAELGVDIGPLLAGAGILGLAVGFGAQTLVKDLLTGVTILLEDGATVGDVVDVAGHAGVVEEMRVRLIRLRDLAGSVHLVPYSEVTTIINYTKDFSYALMEVGVAYREDTDEVCRVLEEVTEEMRGDEMFRNDILEGLEILGVDKFADSAVVIKVRIMTRAGKQWGVMRQFNRRMKKRFDELDIEIPFPHTTVYFGVPREGQAPPARLAITEAPRGSVGALASPEAER